MLSGVDQYVATAFAKTEHATTATVAIRLYEQNVLPLSRLADVIVRRLLKPGVIAPEIALLLEKVAAEAETLMKLSSTMQKLGEQPPADRQLPEVRERSVPNQKGEHSAQSTPRVTDLLVARAPPWNRVVPIVIDTILETLTDKGLMEAFVMHSMDNGLVARYEALGREDADFDSHSCANFPYPVSNGEPGDTLARQSTSSAAAGCSDQSVDLGWRHI